MSNSSLQVSIATANDHLRWDKFVETCSDVQYAHAFAFRSVVEQTFGLTPSYLIVENQSNILGVCPLFSVRSILHWNREFLISLPFVTTAGALCHTEKAVEALKAYLLCIAEKKKAVIQLRHCASQAWQNTPSFDGYVTLRLDLSSASKHFEKSLSGRNRTKVRRALKEGVSVCFGKEELLSCFYRIYFARQREFSTPAYPKSYFQALLKAYPESQIALALLNGKAISGMFNLGYKSTLHYAYGASDSRYHRLYPNNLLFFEVIQAARGLGYHHLDFGRSEIGSGTYTFKKQWGAEVAPLKYQYLGQEAGELAQMSISSVKSSYAFALFHGIWSRLLPDSFIHLLSNPLIKRMPLA